MLRDIHALIYSNPRYLKIAGFIALMGFTTAVLISVAFSQPLPGILDQ